MSIEKGVVGVGQKYDPNRGGAMLPRGGRWIQLLVATNNATIWTKDVERLLGFWLGPQLIESLAFNVRNSPDSGAIVRLGIRADNDGSIGKPVVDIPVTVTGSAWNAVTVNHFHPGGALYISLTTQNWTTTGVQLDESAGSGALPNGILPIYHSDLDTLGWSTGHGAVVAAQAVTAGESLPALFKNTQTSNLTAPVIAARRGD